MTIHIESHHVAEDTALMKEINSKLGHLSDKYPIAMQTSIVLKSEKSDVQKGCVMTAKVALPGKTIYASEAASNFRTAFDNLLQDLDQQLRKTKEIMNEKR